MYIIITLVYIEHILTSKKETNMVKITTENITKISEDLLCYHQDMLFDQGNFDSIEYRMIDAELDRRSDIFIDAKIKKKEAELKVDKILQDTISELRILVSSHSDKVVMKAMVEEFGDAFKDDYKIGDDFTVYSSCKNTRNSTLKNQWPCQSHGAASKKIFALIYDRVYHHYFRGGPENGAIIRLKLAINCIIKGE